MGGWEAGWLMHQKRLSLDVLYLVNEFSDFRPSFPFVAPKPQEIRGRLHILGWGRGRGCVLLRGPGIADGGVELPERSD